VVHFWKQWKTQYYDFRQWDWMYRNMKGKTTIMDNSDTSIRYINKPGIVFSFDDSFRVHDWYEYGKDLFGYYDVQVTFNINALHHYENFRELHPEEIDLLLDLQHNGHEIAHHGYSHKDVVEYTKEVGLTQWLKDEIEALFVWMERQQHSKTGEKFKKPVTFVFPYFTSNEETLHAIVPKYFKVARGFHRGDNLTPFGHTGFAPSICIDQIYLTNPRNLKRILRLVKQTGKNLIITCHSILPKNVGWEKYGWPMTDHEKKWRTSQETIQYIIEEAKLIDLEFYTTAEVSGIATFIDRNLEYYVRNLLNKQQEQWIFIHELVNIKELDLSNLGITNLDGIQYFLNLKKLNLQNNFITDLRLLQKLPNLVDIQLGKKDEVNIL
jgi:peptidoglycan/xylan/chitin deacetylase (PgdA/CDA1 family)